MRNEGRDLIFFPSRAQEVLSLNAADRDQWLLLEMRRARARTIRHGLTAIRNWVARRLGLGRTVAGGNVVSVRERTRSGEQREAGRRVA
ncbi:MAG: hypothetical protein U5L11_11775 [Arhodomonas sp.]|nr:hypothetical protein [Arhodomonas sp.]